MVKHDIKIIKDICPKMLGSYEEAIKYGEKYLLSYGITENKYRYAHFFAHCIHETAYLTKEYENLNYSAQGLIDTWPSRFKPKGLHEPLNYAKNPEKIANLVYGGRMGNVVAGDGWLYRGRGFLNLTGKDNYKNASSLVLKTLGENIDFVKTPDFVLDKRYAILIVCEYFKSRNVFPSADRDDIRSTTKLINGGLIGVMDRTTIKNKILIKL